METVSISSRPICGATRGCNRTLSPLYLQPLSRIIPQTFSSDAFNSRGSYKQLFPSQAPPSTTSEPRVIFHRHNLLPPGPSHSRLSESHISMHFLQHTRSVTNSHHNRYICIYYSHGHWLRCVDWPYTSRPI